MIARDHEFAERILSLVPINGLGERLQEQALAQGELLEFKRRKTVFEAGARDPYTFYLLDGELELQAEDASPLRMRPGDENARRALAQLQPRRYTAIAMSPVTVFRIERAVLDNILADEQVLEEGSLEVQELDEADDDSDWMSRLLSSELFIRLPHENIQRFFTELEPVETEKDELIVQQGSQGDFLYIVAEGRCVVTRRAPGSGQQVQLAVLKEGDTFGEESLISNSPRNASVSMLTPGMLMRLGKESFNELVSNPTLKAVPWSEATQMVEAGAGWLDVRFPDEHTAHAIPDSHNLPLNTLRLLASKLPKDRHYIVYCDSGARSSAGAFLLARMGFEVCYLAGGLQLSPLGEGRAAAPPRDSADEAVADPSFEFAFAGDETQPATGGELAERIDDKAPAASAAPSSAPTAVPAPSPTASPSPTPSTPPAPRARAVQPAQPAQPSPDQAAAVNAQVRSMIANLKAERDRAAAYARKAALAVQELRRRNEELDQRSAAERSRRETLEKDLAAAQADAERQATLERTRLEGELEKLTRRFEAQQKDYAGQLAQIAAEHERLQVQADDAAAGAAALQAELAAARNARASLEAAAEDASAQAHTQSEDLRKRLGASEQELGELRERLAASDARFREAVDDREARSSQVEQAVRQAQQEVSAARERLQSERSALEKERAALDSARAEAEARRRTERAELEQAATAQQTREQELARVQAELARARAALDDESATQRETLSRNEQELAAREAELSREKAAWATTVENAIEEERERLESAYARYREEAAAEAATRADALADARIAELRAEHDAHEAQMRGQVEAHVAKLLAEFDTRLGTVRSGYETRLMEQEAILEDEHRRLEGEVVRLREALADSLKQPRPPRAPAAAPAAPALDFELNEQAAAAADMDSAGSDLLDMEAPLHMEPAPRAADAVAETAEQRPEQDRDPGAPPAPREAAAEAAPVPPDLTLDLEGAVAAQTDSIPSAESPVEPKLELDLEIEDTPAAPVPPKAPRPGVPVLDVPVGKIEKEAVSESARETKRVISPAQIADIRRKMEEKMRAAKSRTG